MSITYDIYATMKLDSLPSVGNVINPINKFMNDMGFSEKMTIRSGKFKMMNLTSETEKTQSELNEIKRMIQKHVDEGGMEEYGIIVEEIVKA